MTIGERIRAMREDNDIKQEEVAKVLGITQSHYSKYERGTMEVPTDRVIALCRYYKITPSYFLGFDNKPTKIKK